MVVLVEEEVGVVEAARELSCPIGSTNIIDALEQDESFVTSFSVQCKQ